MTKSQLKQRWQTAEGQRLLLAVRKSFKRKKNIADLPGISFVDGRIDLRGAPLSEVVKSQVVGTKEHSFEINYGSLDVKRASLVGIDFSYANISYAYFQGCKFDNCFFDSTVAKGIRIYNCDFSSCDFNACNLSYAFLNSNIADNAGSYINCNFKNCNLKETFFSFPLIEHCIFDNCKFYATDFDGSRMRNVKFIGKVESPIFRGFSTNAQTSILWLFNRIDPRDYRNRMENVDFTEAELDDLLFLDEIDISSCRFPATGEFILVKDIHAVFPNMRAHIESEWEGEDRRQGLFLIDNLFYSEMKQGMKMDLISTVRNKYLTEAFQTRFFTFLKEVVSSAESF
ncbi:pentapeptide repeat-containing protein [Pedobacter faecalis]|uniref:pentapeptide repeat-containing protein n=1 Tax=Pedobacter faecalis TaxID=3041495 RepID=UPI00254DCCD9|nr:pentapeptide repeat-containing protein [Pedobacter sp. ELA7]